MELTTFRAGKQSSWYACLQKNVTMLDAFRLSDKKIKPEHNWEIIKAGKQAEKQRQSLPSTITVPWQPEHVVSPAREGCYDVTNFVWTTLRPLFFSSAIHDQFVWLVLHVTQLLCVLPTPTLKLTLRHIMSDRVTWSTKGFCLVVSPWGKLW